MKLSRMMVDMLRRNVLDFQAQSGKETLMPMLPKRLLIMADTMDELYDDLERRQDARSSEKLPE